MSGRNLQRVGGVGRKEGHNNPRGDRRLANNQKRFVDSAMGSKARNTRRAHSEPRCSAVTRVHTTHKPNAQQKRCSSLPPLSPSPSLRRCAVRPFVT